VKSLYSPDWSVVVDHNEARVDRAEKLLSGVQK